MGWRSSWLLGWALVACSTPAPLQGPGGRCFLVSDCKLGLACVTQSDQTRRCSSDLSGIVSLEEAGAAQPRPVSDAGQVVDAAVAPVDAAVAASADDAGNDAIDDSAPQE